MAGDRASSGDPTSGGFGGTSLGGSRGEGSYHDPESWAKGGFSLGSLLGGLGLGLVGGMVGAVASQAQGDPTGENVKSSGGGPLYGGESRYPTNPFGNENRELMGSGINPGRISARDAFEKTYPLAPPDTIVTRLLGEDTTLGEEMAPPIPEIAPPIPEIPELSSSGSGLYGSFSVSRSSSPLSKRVDPLGGFSSSSTSPDGGSNVAEKYGAKRQADEFEELLTNVADKKEGDGYGYL